MIISELNKEQIEKLCMEQMINDFPKEELKPTELILHLADRGVYFGFGLFEDEDNDMSKLKAYALLAKDNKSNWYLLDYFAVVSKYRQGGFGSWFLNSLMKTLNERSEGIILEIELIDAARNNEERDIRTRRRNFYLKNNIFTSGISSKVFETEFEILYYADNKEKKRELIEEKYSDIYKTMLPIDMFEKNFELC